MKKLLYVTAAVAALSAAPAFAGTTVTSVATDSAGVLQQGVPGSTFNLTFDHVAYGSTAEEAALHGLVATITTPASRTFDPIQGGGTSAGGVNVIAPNPNDGNGYFAVGVAPGALQLTSATQAFSSISFFVGTLDSYNTVDLLDAAGKVIQSFDGIQMYDQNGALPPRGNPNDPAINRRVTFTGTDGTTYSGIRFSNAGSGNSAFEIDNVSFTAAVPEPTTWAMMMIGFAMVGAAARYRRRSSNVRYA